MLVIPQIPVADAEVRLAFALQLVIEHFSPRGFCTGMSFLTSIIPEQVARATKAIADKYAVKVVAP